MVDVRSRRAPESTASLVSLYLMKRARYTFLSLSYSPFFKDTELLLTGFQPTAYPLIAAHSLSVRTLANASLAGTTTLMCAPAPVYYEKEEV